MHVSLSFPWRRAFRHHCSVQRYEVAGWNFRASDFNSAQRSAVRLRYSMSKINGLPPAGSDSAKPHLCIMPTRHGGDLPVMTKQNTCRQNALMLNGRKLRPVEP
jgi:hypothetical protein